MSEQVKEFVCVGKNALRDKFMEVCRNCGYDIDDTYMATGRGGKMNYGTFFGCKGDNVIVSSPFWKGAGEDDSSATYYLQALLIEVCGMTRK